MEYPWNKYKCKGRFKDGYKCYGGNARHDYGRKIAEEGGYQCAYCGRDLIGSYENWLSLSVDHVIGQKFFEKLDVQDKTYKDNIANLVLSCDACNGFLQMQNIEPEKVLVNEPLVLNVLKINGPLTDLMLEKMRDRFFEYKYEFAGKRHEKERQEYERQREIEYEKIRNKFNK